MLVYVYVLYNKRHNVPYSFFNGENGNGYGELLINIFPHWVYVLFSLESQREIIRYCYCYYYYAIPTAQK
jgi:hypothetical protein